MFAFARMLRIAGLVGSASFLVSAAVAEPLDYNWTGLSVYGGGGGASYRGDAGLSDTTSYSVDGCLIGFCGGIPFSPVSDNSNARMSGAGGFGTVGLAADFEPVHALVVGAFADVDFYSGGADFSGDPIKFNISTSTSSAFSGKLNFDYSTTVGGRVGLLSLDRRALAYVLVGWTRLEAGGTAEITDTGTATVTLGMKNFSGSISNPMTVSLPGTYDGFTVGLGTQVKLDQFWSLKLEGRYTDLGSQSVSYSGSSTKTVGTCPIACLYGTATSNGSLSLDPQIFSARVALSYNFY
jgi:opacity protein-like surface antigen